MTQSWGGVALQKKRAGMGPQTPVGEPETANWQSSPSVQSALLKQVEEVPLVGAVLVGSTTDVVVLADAEGVATVVFTGAAVDVGTTAAVVVVVGGVVCKTVVVGSEVVVTLGGVVVAAAVVVSPGAAGSCPGAAGPGAGPRGSLWATMPVGAVARRVRAHSIKREVALDSFMVERFSGVSMWKECRSETNRVVQEQTGGGEVKYRRERKERRDIRA